MRIEAKLTKQTEELFTGIANANWDTQYLDVSGKVYNKSIFARIAHFFGVRWNSNIETTLLMLQGRMICFDLSSRVEGEKAAVFCTMVDKIDQLIDRINAKREVKLAEDLKIQKSRLGIFCFTNAEQEKQQKLLSASQKKPPANGALAASVAAETQK